MREREHEVSEQVVEGLGPVAAGLRGARPHIPKS